LMSHLATADNPNNYLNQIQVKNFQKALLICKENNIHPQWIHLSNSDGLLSIPYLYSRYTPGGENLARIGLALYGIGYNPNLKPVLNLKSKITQIKKLKKGDRVGYGGTFVANRPLTIGTLPLGYYDGFDFRLSNKGFIKVNNIFCPIVGKISMNITTIDLNKVKDVQIGQEVVIYSNDFADKNSINESAKICNTIPYNLLVHLAESTKRSIV
jgi:alanine racemase